MTLAITPTLLVLPFCVLILMNHGIYCKLGLRESLVRKIHDDPERLPLIHETDFREFNRGLVQPVLLVFDGAHNSKPNITSNLIKLLLSPLTLQTYWSVVAMPLSNNYSVQPKINSFPDCVIIPSLGIRVPVAKSVTWSMKHSGVQNRAVALSEAGWRNIYSRFCRYTQNGIQIPLK